MGLVVAAEPVLDGGALRRQLDPARNRVGGKQGDCGKQRRIAAFQLAKRPQRRGERDTNIHLSLVGQRAAGAGPPRTSEPPRPERAPRRPLLPRAGLRQPPHRPALRTGRCGGRARPRLHPWRSAPRPLARGPRVANRPAWLRRPPCARVGGGTRSGAAPASCARGPVPATRRGPRAPRHAEARRSPRRGRARTARPRQPRPGAVSTRRPATMRARRRVMPRRRQAQALRGQQRPLQRCRSRPRGAHPPGRA